MAKKRKVRVAFKKNRQHRARANDLTSSFRDGSTAAEDGVSGERIRAKGDFSRKRTIMQDEPERIALLERPRDNGPVCGT